MLSEFKTDDDQTPLNMALLKLCTMLVFLEIVGGSLNTTSLNRTVSTVNRGIVPSSFNSSDSAEKAVILNKNNTGNTKTAIILSSSLDNSSVPVEEPVIKASLNGNSTVKKGNKILIANNFHKVLIYDSNNYYLKQTNSLRGGFLVKKKKVVNPIKCILYQEFDEVNRTQLINEHYMYTLDDVALFFEIYLETRVCYGSCD